jgi:hypothetical protein
MATEHILALLIQERDRLNRAIEALSGSTGKRRGRPPSATKRLVPNFHFSMDANRVGEKDTAKKRKPLSAATRRKMAIAQKKRYAAAKEAK